MKRRGKFLSAGIAMAVLVSVMQIPASALTTVSLSGGQNRYAWDPDVYEVRVENDGAYFRMVSYIKFDSENVNMAVDPTQDLYYVLEHLNKKDNGTATLDDLYSNFPYAKYDLDDDGDGDKNVKNCEEELEVACLSKGDAEPFLAGATYFFDTTWHNPVSSRVVMQGSVRSQKSMLSGYGELQAHATEYHGDTPEYSVAGASSRILNSKIEKNASTIVAALEIENTNECNLTMQNQYNELLSKNVVSTEEKALLEYSNATVTFTGPISEEDVIRIAKACNAELKSCTLKYVDEQGLRITGWTDDLSEENLQRKLDYLREIHGDVKYSGVVSAEMVVDVTADTYKNLMTDEMVYFADLSDTIIRMENGDFENELKIKVWDLSWNLEPSK